MLKDFIKIEVIGTNKLQRKVTRWQGSVGETHRTWDRTCWLCAPASSSTEALASSSLTCRARGHTHPCARTLTTHVCMHAHRHTCMQSVHTWAPKYSGTCVNIRSHMCTGARAHTQGLARFILLNWEHGEPCRVRALTGFSGGRSPDLMLLVRWLKTQHRCSQDAEQRTWVLTYVSYKKIKN